MDIDQIAMCYIIYQWICLDKLYKWKAFSKIQITFWNNHQKPKIFKWIASCEYWSKCNVLYMIYQWIRLNKIYKLVETFFFKFWIIWIIGRKPKNVWTNTDQRALCYISMDATRKSLQANGKLFFKFQNHFSNQPQFFKIIVPLGLYM